MGFGAGVSPVRMGVRQVTGSQVTDAPARVSAAMSVKWVEVCRVGA